MSVRVSDLPPALTFTQKAIVNAATDPSKWGKAWGVVSKYEAATLKSACIHVSVVYIDNNIYRLVDCTFFGVHSQLSNTQSLKLSTRFSSINIIWSLICSLLLSPSRNILNRYQKCRTISLKMYTKYTKIEICGGTQLVTKYGISEGRNKKKSTDSMQYDITTVISLTH